MMALPADDYRLTVMVDYNSPVLGSQHASIVNLSEFTDEISSCRTFCFLHELEMLVKHDLIKGGDLNNAIVIVDRVIKDSEMASLAKLFNKDKIEVKKEGILNNVELRFQNEPARHKLLDVVGDLALAGVPLKAQILAARPGHAANVEFAKKIKKAYLASKKAKKENNVPVYDQNAVPLYNYQQVAEILPHRHPFLLVDKIVKLTATEVIAVKNITGDQYFFQGHFPGEPLMPGVLQIEAMAQAGGVLVLADKEDPSKWSTYFVKIENAKFKDKVVPGDTLVLRMALTGPVRRGLCMMKGEAYVGNRLVCEANMMAQIVENR
jgi:UDP-3-O-[3-hydroxymyristoyl] N-acetylglucosamine deacetylase/3-hydroxyacyl-[acyl-carrier-protein] dehydratase